MFIDRRLELELLERLWRTPGAQLAILYGRRRVGKTALVREFVRGKAAVYYMAARLPEAMQLRELGAAVGAAFDDPLLAENGFANWSQVFAYLARRSDRFVLVIDEYPFLVESNAAVSSLWQRGWDEHLSGSQAMVVLLGSSVGMMERETLDSRAPLFGRRTGQLRLRPFPFREAREFLPGYSFAGQVRSYAALGGIPYYLSRFDSRRPLAENISEQILSTGAVLREEVEFLLRQEFQEPRTYFAIMQALAQGKRRPSEIANATFLSHGTLSKYLSVLQQLDLVVRDVPATEPVPSKSKKGLYAIADPYVRFWFRFVQPQRSLLELGRVEEALEVILAGLDAFTGPVYEEVCRQETELGLLEAATGVRWQRVGRWWDRTREVDVVAFSPDGRRLLMGECTWSNRPVGTNVLRDLRDTYSAVVQLVPEMLPTYALFSRSGFTAGLRDEVHQHGDVVLVEGLEPITPGNR